MTTKIEAIIPLPGLHFGTDFYVRATIEVESFGIPETGAGYLADPFGYDPGSAPEWSISGIPTLYRDNGLADEDALDIGPQFAAEIKEFIETDDAVADVVESIIAKEKAEA